MATLQIRMDDEIKTSADALFSSLGLDTSTAVRIFLSAALESNGLPFAVRHASPKRDLLEALNDARSRRNLTGPFDNVDDAMKSLLED